MDAERRERLKALLVEGEMLDQAARTAWLAGLHVADPTLAAELSTLLGATTRPELRGEGVARALEQALAEVSSEPSGLPRDLGPYRLLEVIGHGGMGVVYRAEQTSPFRREVAIKALRGGWRPDELRARVAAERRALALMEHPGIARLYDAIVDEHDTPYLVMELVRGELVTDFVRGRGLATRATLELFVTACRAVQHAHQRGIIHRDLKPSNLLVTEVDGRAIAKVIDFGVARLTSEDGDHSRLTRDGQVVGTLDYMSPEQAAGRTTEADTRSDVYSLGVVLYELLSGARPRELERLPAQEALRLIADSAVRPLRQAAPERGIAADLEAIVHKSLEREPARRYDGPGALADDLERFLRSEPVTARPPSAAYELRMLARRHRVPVLGAAALLLIMTVFGITMTVLYESQRRAQERASTEGAKAAAISRFLQGLLSSPDPARGARDMTVRELLDQRLSSLPSELGGQPEVMAEVQATLGRTYSGLGEYGRGDSLLRAALAAQRANAREPGGTIRALLDLAKNAQRDGRFAQSREQATEAADLARTWERRDPARYGAAAALRAEGLSAIGEALLSEGKQVARAESALIEAVAIEHRLRPEGSPELAEALLRLGRVYWAVGPWPKADSVLREAMAVSEKAEGPGHPRQIEILSALGLVVRLNVAPATAAEPLLAEALRRTVSTYGDRHPAVAPALNNLALATMHRDWFAAESLTAAAVRRFETYGAAYHEDMSAAYKNLAAFRESEERFDEAIRLNERALAVSREHNPPGHWLEIAPHVRLSAVYSALGRHDRAVREAREAVRLCALHRGWESVRMVDPIEALALAHLGAGRTDSACVWAQRMVLLKPEYPGVWLWNRICESDSAGARAAIGWYLYGRTDSQRTSNNRAMTRQLSRYFDRVGRPDRADSLRRRLVETRPVAGHRPRPIASR